MTELTIRARFALDGNELLVRHQDINDFVISILRAVSEVSLYAGADMSSRMWVHAELADHDLLQVLAAFVDDCPEVDLFMPAVNNRVTTPQLFYHWFNVGLEPSAHFLRGVENANWSSLHNTFAVLMDAADRIELSRYLSWNDAESQCLHAGLVLSSCVDNDTVTVRGTEPHLGRFISRIEEAGTALVTSD